MICRYCGEFFESSSNNICCDKCNQFFNDEFIKLQSLNQNIRHCKYCGKPFVPKGTQVYCKGIHNDGFHYRECVTCKSAFLVNVKESDKKTCSKECRRISFANSGKGRFIPKSLKKCKYCGKLFQLASSRQIYCKGPHYSTCSVCGNQFEIDLSSDIPKTCSKECKLKQIKQTNLDKYGEDSIFKTEKFKEEQKQRCLDKYGVEYYTQTDEYRDKYQSTCLDRYGVISPLQNEEIKQKFIQTNQKRYGGNSPTCSQEIREKIINSNRQKYGYDWYTQQPEVKDHIIQSLINRHAESIQDESKRQEYLKFRKDPKSYLESLGTKISIFDLTQQLGYADTTSVLDYVNKYGLQSFIQYHKSSMEAEVISFIQSLDSNIKIIENDRLCIASYELDIYLPEYNLAIECNPTVTHNSTLTLNMIIDESDHNSLSSNYHKMKTDLCQQEGIFLFHIFGYEWTNKKDIIKSMIRNLLNENLQRLYARKLNVVTIDSVECLDFLNSNHRQGNASSSIRLGLKTSEGELASVMTFGKMRSTIGMTKNASANDWELIRFCNKINTSVVGGASKLFRYFIRNYQFDRIVSFSDRAHTKGGLYEKLGFIRANCSDPGYFWVNLNTDLYLNRVSCQKRNLRNLFKDESIDIENKTESQIMSERGFVQVFDSGTIRWEFYM